jgi:hypothetical protein
VPSYMDTIYRYTIQNTLRWWGVPPSVVVL